MKIEIGESLMFSWLRHVKHCQTVQLNWKPAVNTWEMYNEKLVIKIMGNTSQYIKENYMINIFKNNQSHTQILKQGEIDVLGLELRYGRVAEIYGIETAFHENGLNYGRSDQTVEKVIKNMVRMSMIMVGYFDLTKGKIIFAAPKVSTTIYKPLTYLINEMNEFYKSMNLDFEFILYANDTFQKQVLNPVVERTKTVADTSELFMRSVQMNNLFKETAAAVPAIEPIQEKKTSIPRSISKNSRDHRTKVSTEILMKEIKVAYYLSRFEPDKLFPRFNKTQVFEESSNILGVKPNTLRNKRDMFDPFCNKLKTRGPKRKGWWQNDRLPDDMQSVYYRYLHMLEEEIEKEIIEILKMKVEI
jgi:hypothetical protein